MSNVVAFQTRQARRAALTNELLRRARIKLRLMDELDEARRDVAGQLASVRAECEAPQCELRQLRIVLFRHGIDAKPSSAIGAMGLMHPKGNNFIT
jgi:hypothetical protein